MAKKKRKARTKKKLPRRALGLVEVTAMTCAPGVFGHDDYSGGNGGNGSDDPEPVESGTVTHTFTVPEGTEIIVGGIRISSRKT